MIRNRNIWRLLSGSRRFSSCHAVSSIRLLASSCVCRQQRPAVRYFTANSESSSLSRDSKDWFPPGPLNSCPWDADAATAWLEPLDHKPLDYQTRHAIQLLQEFYWSGGRHLTEDDDDITTARCNMLLQQLLDMSSSSDNGARHRANAILQSMQLFDSRLFAKADLMFKQPRRLVRHLPHPTIDTFNLVLRLFAKTSSNHRSVPDRALELVQALRHRYQATGDIACQIHPFHYNCVLQAWRFCQDWQRAAHAAHVFLQVMDADMRDESSFVTMFRICAPSSKEKRQQPDQQAKELNALVAIKIWQAVIADDTSLDLKSHVYTHFMQAIRELPLDSSLRAEYYQACFQRAVDHGKVNIYLISELLVHGHSPKVYNQFFGPFWQVKSNSAGMNATRVSQSYLEAMPESWKWNADL